VKVNLQREKHAGQLAIRKAHSGELKKENKYNQQKDTNGLLSYI
jgi:hypothetical protein